MGLKFAQSENESRHSLQLSVNAILCLCWLNKLHQSDVSCSEGGAVHASQGGVLCVVWWELVPLLLIPVWHEPVLCHRFSICWKFRKRREWSFQSRWLGFGWHPCLRLQLGKKKEELNWGTSVVWWESLHKSFAFTSSCLCAGTEWVRRLVICAVQLGVVDSSCVFVRVLIESLAAKKKCKWV